ncbi:trafficking kinesin-binding protein 1 [Myxocyprinus asiaticus]|uniref:trafficking kinesin-binding protein 1 n=1 Tax=Myxocyprinus asiaticus TaxID=70543 RepID=UPI002221CBEF|nr:trafficking kinesin-binding protein 1 [Myxocyprinus asiaticus]
MNGPSHPGSQAPITLNPSGLVTLSHSPDPAFSPPTGSPQPSLEPPGALILHGEQGEGCRTLAQEHCLSPGNLREGVLPVQGFHDVSTLTDLCSSVDLPEVEIVSLLREELPTYTLRADHVFGYEHDDWLHIPLVPAEAAIGLTQEQIEETLKYFLLCSERVGQITKTYHDIEAVTHLLEEKERDLELAARIGQSLLKQNKALTERNKLLDEQLEIAKEEIAQLRHELSMRDDLLHFYASTEEIEHATESLLIRNDTSSSLSNYMNYDFLQQKLKGLEEENFKLRSEANELTFETNNYEEQEQQLMMVCVDELSMANKRVASLSEELSRRVEDSLRQQEEISSLLGQIVDLEQRCKGLAAENEELMQHLNSSRESQSQLKTELKELRDRYSECEDMLHEAQEDIKNLRNKSLPNSTVQRYSTLAAIFPMDSLAAEIEGTFRKGLDSPAPTEYKNHPLRVFETVKIANQVARLRSQIHSPQVPGSSPGSLRSSRISTPRTSYYESDSASFHLEDKHSPPTHTQEHGLLESKRLGQPGTPGGQDLEAALRSLSERQESHTSERPFFEVERERKLRALQSGSSGSGGGSSGILTPNDSVVSTGTNYSGTSTHSSGTGSSRSYLPERLQIVKPMEGSVTLHQWQQLAKPNLGGILHPRPGVLTKDFRELDVDFQHVYSLNDLEEDEPDMSKFPDLIHGTVVTSSGLNLPQTTPNTSCQNLHPSVLLSSFSTSLRPRSMSAFRSCEHVRTSSGLQSISASTAHFHPTTHPSCLGLLQLVSEHGISASTHPSSHFTHRAIKALSTASGERQWNFGGSEQESREQERQRNIFSVNLVEKLRRLGLYKVVERGLLDSGGKEKPDSSNSPT